VAEVRNSWRSHERFWDLRNSGARHPRSDACASRTTRGRCGTREHRDEAPRRIVRGAGEAGWGRSGRTCMVVCACVSASVSDRGSSLPIEKASKRQCDQSDIFRARAIPSLNGMPSHNPERARERFRVSFRYRRSAIVATVCLWVDGEISARSRATRCR
jgi:hypothetical protein